MIPAAFACSRPANRTFSRRVVEVTGFLLRRQRARLGGGARAQTGGTHGRVLEARFVGSFTDRQSGTLITVEADLLAQRTVGNSQILECTRVSGFSPRRSRPTERSTAMLPAAGSGSPAFVTVKAVASRWNDR